MLKINYEFRKGIFFLRLIGELNKNNYLKNDDIISEIIKINKFKYIVINTNYLEKIDMTGLSYILKICNMTKESNSSIVICDKSKMINKLFNYNIPNIESELEVL